MARISGWLLAFTIILGAVSPGSAQVPLLLNYQGRLLNGTNLVNGSVGLSLRLFNVPTGGTRHYEDSNTVTVADGLYSTLIGDGTTAGSLVAALTNPAVYVEVAVNGVALTPRERLVAAAYALSLRGLQVDPNGNVVALPDRNSAAASAQGAVITGGSSNRIEAFVTNSFLGGGFANVIESNVINSVLGGGNYNEIGQGVRFSVLGGGLTNRLDDLATAVVLVGGVDNFIGTNCHFSFLGGGYDNQVSGFSWGAVVAGGFSNSLYSSLFAFLGGGQYNVILDSDRAVVAGGRDNVITSSLHSAIGGGAENRIEGNAEFAVIPGGQSNTVANAATHALAAGYRAKANHPGTLVWADEEEADFASTAPNQFLVRAGGGVGINTNSPQATLHVRGEAKIGPDDSAPRFAMTAVALPGSGTVFVHPGFTNLTMTWDGSSRVLTVTNTSLQYVDVRMRMEEDVDNLQQRSGFSVDDITISEAVRLTNTTAGAAGWTVTAVVEDQAGPGFKFDGLGYDDGISGLITYWY